jgi:NADPH-dependent 2,4-dienoyl-CoA reductase/sulfur reductase-like enzyme
MMNRTAWSLSEPGKPAFQVAASLRMEGYEGPIALVGDEPNLPYQRPPLSKGFMAGKQDIEGTAVAASRPFMRAIESTW